MTCPSCGSADCFGVSCETYEGASLEGTLIAGRAVRPPLPPFKLPDGSGADSLLGVSFGSFKAVKRIGVGGMGTVYLGEHSVIGSKVAIKVLHEHLAHDPALVQRFYDEARSVNLIGHENIVSIFDMNVLPPRSYYLIMEFLEGRTLASLAKQALPPATAIPILVQVCEALHAAHQRGIVHRDLKPENVFLVKRNRTEHFVKLMDFGIAKLLAKEGAQRQTSEGMIIGTPEFMAPEQTSADPVDGRADVYALGVMTYLLATGRLPFTEGGVTGVLLAHRQQAPTPPEQVNPRVSRAWSQVILKALAKRPEDRFATALQMAARLEEVLAGSPGPEVVVAPAKPEPTPEALVTPEPLHSRHQTSLQCTVRQPGQPPVSLTCSDLSRGGMFVSSDAAFPPVFSRLELIFHLPEGPMHAAGEVVRHVTVEQARAWGMSPGFGVQFVEPTATFKERIDAQIRGLPYAQPPQPARAVADDPVADVALSFFRKRINGDHYVILSLQPDCDFDQLRTRARECRAELEGLKGRALSAAQLQQVEDVLARVRRAQEEVGSPKARAAYDARRGNFRGVARCISAGLTVTELEALRRDYQEGRGEKLTRAHLHLATGKAWEGQGQLGQALEEYEAALILDPLNLELQQRYWGLKRRSGDPRPKA